MNMKLLTTFALAGFLCAGPVACKKKNEQPQQDEQGEVVQEEQADKAADAQEKDQVAKVGQLTGSWILDADKTIKAAGENIDSQEEMMMRMMRIGMHFGDDGSFATRVSMMGQGEEMKGTYSIEESTDKKVTIRLVPEAPEHDDDADDLPTENMEPSNMTVQWLDKETIRVIASDDTDDQNDADEPVMIFHRASESDYKDILKPKELTPEQMEMLRQQQNDGAPGDQPTEPAPDAE